MSRPQVVWLLVALMVLSAILFVYKTPNTPTGTPDFALFAGVSLKLDYATTTAEREIGLGGRINVPDGYGMLFVFPKDGRYGFWMKDTLVPLDMFWLDAQGHVVYVAPDVATSTFPTVFYPARLARYVLETAAGFARAHHVTVGTPLILKNFPVVSK